MDAVVEATDEFGVQPHRGSRRRPSLQARPLHRAMVIWLLSGILAAGAVKLFLGPVRDISSAQPDMQLPWITMVVLFCLGEWARVHIHFRRDAFSISLSEIPLVLGLFMTTPVNLVSARVVGAIISLGLLRRQPPIKLAYNVSLFGISTCCAALLFHALLGTNPEYAPQPQLWSGVLLVTSLLALSNGVMILVAVSLSEGLPAKSRLAHTALFIIATAASNTSLALEAVVIMWRDIRELALLAVPLVTVFVAYRAYAAERQKHERIQFLYQSSDLLQRVSGSDSAISLLLSHLSRVFRAEYAELTVLRAGADDNAFRRTVWRHERVVLDRQGEIGDLEDAMPLLIPERRSLLLRRKTAKGELGPILSSRGLKDGMVAALRDDRRLIGILVVGNRLSDVGTFDTGDLQLFETLASHVKVALQNGQLQYQLKYQAYHDVLTGLANRSLFSDRITHALSRRRSAGGPMVVVLFLDLDDFKMVNDSFGHSVGDSLLIAVADRLRGCLRAFDTAARVGGDEFAVLLEDVQDMGEALTRARRVSAALHDPFVLQGHEVAMHASIGIAVADNNEMTGEELVRRADVAMYRAKQKGKGSLEVYQAGMQKQATERLEIKTQLERAIERGELLVQYQPIVELRSGQMEGVEALLRWRRPRHGIMGPADFIPLAEETGAIIDIGRFVLHEACRQSRQWALDHPQHAPLSMSVNLSPRQLQRPGFTDDLRRVMSITGMDPANLVLEITESFLVEDSEINDVQLHDIKRLGVSLSIDDFGTGYSSLGTLQHLPVDILKIAKPFVERIAEDAQRRSFARAIIGLGKTLKLRMVAEGVERAEQRDQLRDLRCDLGQGFYFAPALDADDVATILRTHSLPQRGALLGTKDALSRIVQLPRASAG
jgi:diguanylate cyclase (GGDEF)-like protein